MSEWDRENPGAGDMAGLDALAARLATHAGTLHEVAGTVRAHSATLTATWTGHAATAWAERTEVVAGQVDALHPVFDTVAAALRAYAREVEQIAADARTAIRARDHAREQLHRARREVLGATFADPCVLQAAIDRARQAITPVVTTEHAVDALSDRRRQADTTLSRVLHENTPPAWTHGGPRLAGLDPQVLSRGTDLDTLATWALSLADDPQGDAALRWRTADLSPQALDDLLATHPHLATRLMRPDLDALTASYPHLGAALEITDPAARLTTVTAALADLPAIERTRLAQTHPWAVGNLDGAPLDVRATANRVAIRAAVPDAERRITEIDARIAENEALLAGIDDGPLGPDEPGSARGLVVDTLDSLRAERQMLLDRIPWCEGLIAEPVGALDYDGDHPPKWHRVVLFDPDAGRFGEVIGTLDAANVAVLVGGTGTNLANMDGQAERAWRFVAERADELAVITYLGGSMPQVLPAAAPQTFANAIAPHLAGFANGVRATVDVPFTVAGHSYGGLVVGRAEVAGMIVDRTAYIEASGSGATTVQEYAAPDTPRYSMTAPGDPIEGVQAMEAHGRDPDEIAGTVRVETGRIYDETGTPTGLVQGLAAHDGVFNVDTDAFRNIHAILTGGTVSLWTPPVDIWEHLVRTGREFPMADPDFVPPTEEVR